MSKMFELLVLKIIQLVVNNIIVVDQHGWVALLPLLVYYLVIMYFKLLSKTRKSMSFILIFPKSLAK